MGIDSDIMELTTDIEASGNIAAWERVCKHINAAEAMVESATDQLSIANANITSNNNLFNYLIDNGIVSREELIKHKISANVAPSWTDEFVQCSTDKES